ncbi:uncharacterized protein LOC115651398 [Gopherus evgoodei]|uniref:uncharacterized protein LOC115651398 n=1 Tax=Gopherus evgoodei TaxID=1825980 RepID=UPI0011D01A15|nr:uncharacterized protein LOC115651398 [Gopherus evgoodei]
MERAERELLATLEKLGERELQRFKDKLSEIQPKKGYQLLPSGSLKDADPPALTDLLLLFYGTDYGAKVAAEVLRAIDQRVLAKRIEKLINALRHEKFIFKRQLLQHGYARGGFMYAKYTLNNEQYQTIRAEKTSQEKMRKLYELMPSWGELQKDRLYEALKKTNRDLVEELEEEHFVDRHREKLIQQVSEVDRVLKLLRGHTLTPEQYQSISTGRSNVEKMQKLYELVPSWPRKRKDRLYRVLWITNSALVDECAEEHFVEQHREQLIQRVSSVDAALDVLKRGYNTSFEEQPYSLVHSPYESPIEEVEEQHFLKRFREPSKSSTGGLLQNWAYILNDEQYQTIRAEKTSQEKMRKLYELVPRWNEWQKDWLYHALQRTNRDLVEELEEEHFVDRHREKLIQRVSEVDRVLKLLQWHTLTPEQYQSISTGRSNVEKMQKLYELVPSWRRKQKDRLHRVLWITNSALVHECAASGEHFVERHQEQLIQRVSSVDATLDVLKQGHDPWFEEQPYSAVHSPYEIPTEELEDHMEVSHDQISTEELTSASGFTSEETKSDSSSAAGTKGAGGIICQQTLLTSTGSVAVAAGEISRSQSPTACLRGQHKCNWCAREEDLPEEIKPEIIQDLDANQETYRVHFSRAGWFCCPETELEFEVRAPVTIQYGYGSWRQHLTESQAEQWMVAGPLFDIRAEQKEAVAAVHLPHFLCLRDADNSRMQIAHFIDEEMTLENPTWVRSFHAVLENPSFSLIGAFWRRVNSDQQTQLHSIVLLYQAQRRVNLTLHLYLIPDDGSRVKAVKDYEKECQSWFVSKSHFTAKPLCFGSFYIVSSPSEITVTPKELPFLDKPAEALQPFTEVHTIDVKKELELSLVEKTDGTPIWEAVIRPEDLAPSVSSIKMQIDTHFVDQHREQLIKRVTAVDSILDSLHDVVLDTEQYQSIRAERTNPDKMRKLYELVPSWNSGCKEKLYQALKDKHRYLVEQLEEK